MKTRRVLGCIFVGLIMVLLLVLSYTTYNTDQINKQLKEELYETKAELDACKVAKSNVENERDNSRMALDEVYELFLTCQRQYEGGE